ncbi:TRAP transporter large permease [Photobacterium sp. BZF1]|uniref:TRAP transporter large permease n=1 Tax=Photobacterium TaxID=657 RepID=UPI001653DBBE|nr:MULTISPECIES: TRAP transporter large permease [Photobacterium]MBC7003094.1 TRAP transporter large permease [Photobacterium sp. BZF1]MBY5945684.1 TRAP transporter large permease [Photobacterium rosenbergii]
MLSLAFLSSMLILGIPLVFGIILSITLFISDTPISLSLIGQRIFGGLDSFSILAIPLFVLAGELMNKSGITKRIITFANALVGTFKGGLAQVNIWSSVMFAGLSGSAVADTSALGRVFIPEMEKEGYSKSFSSALTAASSVIGPMIPPSIPVIIYALIASGVSVPGLFLAGIVPGILSAICLSAYVYYYATKHNIKNTAVVTGRFKAFVNAIIPLTMPVLILGSILMGIVTPTEAAAFAAFYALTIGMFVFKTLKIKDLPEIFITSMRDSSIVLILIAVVSVANWLLTFSQVPQMISQQVLDNITNPIVFLLLVNLILLCIGLFLEGIAAMLILIPILHPIAMSFGIDPIHFGIIVIFNLMIGLITPPMGMCLFVANSISKVGIAAISRQVMPLFIIEVFVLMFITFVPSSVTILPRLFGY